MTETIWYKKNQGRKRNQNIASQGSPSEGALKNLEESSTLDQEDSDLAGVQSNVVPSSKEPNEDDRDRGEDIEENDI